MRKAIAALMRLDGVDGAEVEIPAESADFLHRFLGPDLPRLAPDAELVAATGGVEICPPFCLDAALGRLVQDPVAERLAARFEFAFAPMVPEAETMRAALRRMVRLEAVRAPVEVICDQRERVDVLRRASHHMVEGVVAGPEACAVIENGLSRQPDALGYDRNGMRPALVDMDPDEADALGLLTHQSLVLGELSAEPPGFHDTDAHRDWLMGAALTGLGSALRPDAEATPLEVLLAADEDAGVGGAPYVFFSYAHADTEITQDMLALLDRTGIRVWYDTGLVGGSHWDSQLEERILNAAGVICLVTDRYVASKICQRGMKFADVLGNPLIVLKKPEVTLGAGLAMILASLQYVDLGAPDLDRRVAEAVAHHAAKAIEHDARRQGARA